MAFVSTKFNDCIKYEYDLLDNAGCRGEWSVGLKQKSVCINKIPRWHVIPEYRGPIT